MNRRMKIASAVAATALGAAVGSGVAYAAIPDSGTGVISGCYSTITGAVKVIDAQSGKTCGVLEKPLSWNQTGPQGPVGPVGAVGPAGTEPVMVVESQEDLSTAVPNQGAEVVTYAACPSGTVVIGGYAELAHGNGDLGERAEGVQGNTYPQLNGWQALNPAGDNSVKVYAFCVGTEGVVADNSPSIPPVPSQAGLLP